MIAPWPVMRPSAQPVKVRQRPLWVAGSKGGRNTSIFEKRWSVQDGLSRTDLFHGEAEGGDLGSLAARGVDEFDRADVRSQFVVDLSTSVPDRRDPTAGAEAIASGVEAVRARGDLPRAEGAAVSSNDRPSVATCAIDDQPRGAGQRRPHRLSGCAIGSGGFGIAHVAPSGASSLVARRSAGQYRLSLSSSGRRSKSQAG